MGYHHPVAEPYRVDTPFETGAVAKALSTRSG